MEGLIPCIYRAVVRHSSTHQILSRSSSRRNLLSSADQHSRSGRPFARDVATLPNMEDSGRFIDIALAQDFQVIPPDRTFPSIARSLHRRAGKQYLVNPRREVYDANSFYDNQ